MDLSKPRDDVMWFFSLHGDRRTQPNYQNVLTSSVQNRNGESDCDKQGCTDLNIAGKASPNMTVGVAKLILN